MPSLVLKRLPHLRRITDASCIQRVIATARRYNLVTTRVAFVVGEVRGGARAYSLRAHPSRYVVIRHGSRDMEIFDEIFRAPRGYSPPFPAAHALDERAAQTTLRVLDLGANIGLFAVDLLSQYPSAAVTSYEPEPSNVKVLTRCKTLNTGVDWTIIEACAMAANQTVRVTPGAYADTYVSDEGVPVAGIDVLPVLKEYDFVKMDIEGSEWAILLDERWPDMMRSVTACVLEWHSRGCPTDDAQALAASAVTAAGFVSVSTVPGDHGVLWGWRPSLTRPV
jgi:FkbM family methyltransferase